MTRGADPVIHARGLKDTVGPLSSLELKLKRVLIPSLWEELSGWNHPLQPPHPQIPPHWLLGFSTVSFKGP